MAISPYSADAVLARAPTDLEDRVISAIGRPVPRQSLADLWLILEETRGEHRTAQLDRWLQRVRGVSTELDVTPRELR